MAEHSPEKAGVDSSILSLGTTFYTLQNSSLSAGPKFVEGGTCGEPSAFTTSLLLKCLNELERAMWKLFGGLFLQRSDVGQNRPTLVFGQAALP